MIMYLIGDTHGNSNNDGEKIKKIPKLKDILVIILGDFGFINIIEDKNEKEWFDFFQKLPFKLCFIDGNHENFERLKKFPEIEFYNGTAGFIHNCVYHLKRGQIYIINNKKILTIGGASSIDKNNRIINVSWWKDEEITYLEEKITLENLDKHKWEVDYVLTHTLPGKIIKDNLDFYNIKEDANTKFFDNLIYSGMKFKKWYCGHFHIDKNITNKFQVVYNNIIKMC